jgi:putative hydrolase of the HAD superfamily
VKTTAMIGDNFQTDIIGAKHAGLDTIFFNRFPDYPAPETVTYEITALRQLKDIL